MGEIIGVELFAPNRSNLNRVCAPREESLEVSRGRDRRIIWLSMTASQIQHCKQTCARNAYVGALENEFNIVNRSFSYLVLTPAYDMSSVYVEMYVVYV